MIAIGDDRTTIHLTRGDGTHEDYNNLAIHFPIMVDDEETLYEFQPGDTLRFTVFNKKDYLGKEILTKEYTITEPTEAPSIVLTSTDTKLLEQANKKITYWYDIVLNNDTTLLGMDDKGAKKLIVYPESEEE